MTNPIIKLCVAGLFERSKARFESFLHEIADDLCEIVPEAEAQAIVLDIDTSDFDWREFLNRYPGRPVIVLAKTRPDLQEMIWVPKPIMEVALIEAINWANVSLQTGQLVGQEVSRPEILAVRAKDAMVLEIGTKPDNASPGTDMTQDVRFFDLADCLLDVALEARSRTLAGNQGVVISISGRGQIAFYPRDNLVLSDLGLERMANLARSGSLRGEYQIDTLEAGQARLLREDLESGDALEINDLLWRLGVWTSDGRLPGGTDVDARFYLRCWPNFTRLMQIPSAIRIAALWVREPMDLRFICEALQIRWSDVCTFFSAAFAIGLAGLARRDVDYLIANRARPSPEASRFTNVVRRIGRHLGGGG